MVSAEEYQRAMLEFVSQPETAPVFLAWTRRHGRMGLLAKSGDEPETASETPT